MSQMPTAGIQGAATTPRAGRLISSDSIAAGGFTPGAILIDRYRIIGLLGRGGMGEVYRADDLKLGQPVALKFLPRALANDPVRRERFFSEVRITRQLSHPNICRVYDIAEFEGQHFLSMEYIDGEDLASLIKRIGYLPNEKALQVTRQLVAGLGAAHDRGVLHRDLKPANIMIDGHGRVRITDFGLAVAAGEEKGSAEVFGTPAYMAPEQFAGKSGTVRSDIYSLGLILYEIYCGRSAFTATTIPELRRQKETQMPAPPSEIRGGLDPLIDRLIMRCLERDPQARPSSAAQLALALPGGDPLAAAIAAGETPSPEMVAASGINEGVRPVLALGLILLTIAGSLGAIAMKSVVLERVTRAKTPQVIMEQAQEFLRKAGFSEEPGDSAFGLAYDFDFIRYLQNLESSGGNRAIPDASGVMNVWYRQSPRWLERHDYRGTGVTADSDPPLTYPGEVFVRFNMAGRLTFLEAVPREPHPTTVPATPEWEVLFSQAGLDLTNFKPAEPQQIPPFYSDSRMAWVGSLPDELHTPIRVEASAYKGSPVHFEIIGPWTRPRVAPGRAAGLQGLQQPLISLTFIFLVIGGGLFFARRNLRLGRGDRRGATRIAILVFSLMMFSGLINEHHIGTARELSLFFLWTAISIFYAALVWIVYIALEPFVRRRWPNVLVSWTRILSGDWRDSLVGHDLLVGCASGATLVFLLGLVGWIASLLGTPRVPAAPAVNTLIGSGGALAAWVLLVFYQSMMTALSALFILSFFRIIFRKDWIAVSVLVLILAASNAVSGESARMNVLVGTIILLFEYTLLRRFGLTVVVVSMFALLLLSNNSLTFHTFAWYSRSGVVSLAIVAALAAYGFYTASSTHTLFDISRLEGE
jgi:serine/threonine-protein kinase